MIEYITKRNAYIPYPEGIGALRTNMVNQPFFTDFSEQDDRLFHTFQDATLWLKQNTNHIIKGEVANSEPKDEIMYRQREFSFEIVCHRTHRPLKPIPSIEELKKVLFLGDDNYSNSLIIDYEGNIKLIQIKDISPAAIEGYAVRYETFDAGNEYVGPTSNLLHAEETYRALLESWLAHLETGKQIYCYFIEGTNNVPDLIELINKQIFSLR